jgi:hypothetical protein
MELILKQTSTKEKKLKKVEENLRHMEEERQGKINKDQEKRHRAQLHND